jgi:CubicO group peptidase (beta-lactamase class C family)
MKVFLPFVCLFVLLSSCLKQEPLKLPYKGFTPQAGEDGWMVSSPEKEQMNQPLLDKAYRLFHDENEFPMATCLLVIRNGRLVAEAYAKDEQAIHQIRNIQSCTKSITSLLAGIALKNKIVPDLNVPLYNYYPEAFAGSGDIAKRKITLKNCLEMQGGLDFDNDIHTEELFLTEGNSLQYVLSRPMVHDTGQVFHYNDGLPHLAGGVIARASGMSLENFGKAYLFAPLGITDFKWEKANDGLNFGAFSLYLRPRDLAKLGQLCLQNGNWNGVQLFDPSYLAEATRIRTGGTTPYGFYFWILPSLEGYMMEGHGGQFVFVCPPKKLVAVYTAFPYTSELLWGDMNKLLQLIYQAAK